MISQFFILSPRGDTIIARDYLGNVPKVSHICLYKVATKILSLIWSMLFYRGDMTVKLIDLPSQSAGQLRDLLQEGQILGRRGKGCSSCFCGGRSELPSH